MKFISKILIIFILISSFSFARETIHLANGEWPPYLSKNLTHNGFASHLVKEAFDAVNIDVKYTFLPWKRSYMSAKLGLFNNEICHGTLVWIYTKDRAKDFIYSDELIKDEQVLYYLKEKPIIWEKIEDLEGTIIGVTKHTSYEFFEEAQRKNLIKIERAGNYDMLFDRLLAFRIDAVPQVRNVGNYFLRTKLSKQKREKITYSNRVIQTRKYHLILSKKVEENKRYIELFNKGLKIIKENGLYDKLLNDLNQGFYEK